MNILLIEWVAIAIWGFIISGAVWNLIIVVKLRRQLERKLKDFKI